jgi:hypothetical protein
VEKESQAPSVSALPEMFFSEPVLCRIVTSSVRTQRSEAMSEKKPELRKPDLRDGLPGRATSGIVDSGLAVNPPALRDDILDVAKPGISKHPAGQTTQE